MPLYVKKLDWSKCQGIPTRVNDDVAEEILNYLFNSNGWKTNQDLLVQKMRRWRERLFTTEQKLDGLAPVPASEVADDEKEVIAYTAGADAPIPHWTDVALAMRAENKSWTQIAAATGKSVSTIRDAIKRANKAA